MESDVGAGDGALKLERAQRCQTVRSCARDDNMFYCVNDINPGPSAEDIAGCQESQCTQGEGSSLGAHCDYKEEIPRRVLSANLADYAPEAAHFLANFEITTEDLESIMGHWAYDSAFTAYPNKVKVSGTVLHARIL